jgi:hypothetical protein
MGRQRGFLPPPLCQQCGNAPQLGQTLWPADKWRCVICLEDSLPGKDNISKSMLKMMEYSQELYDSFDLEERGLKAEEPRNRAEWARHVASELRKQGTVRSREIAQANGEAVSPTTGRWLHDTLTIPDVAAVEASFDRSRLLLHHDVAAMALDAANSIQATNSMEKMLAHQLAAAHKAAMELLGYVPYDENAVARSKRVNAAARCMTVYQQGLLTLRKLRQNGNQRIMVQYVNVSEGGQAVIGNSEKE